MKQQILVCDAEHHITRLIQVNLERHGYAVTTANDCAQARQHLESETFEHVILNASMGGFDAGYEVLSHIRSRKETENIAVTIVFVSDEDRAEWELRPYRGDRAVVMPFTPSDLVP